MKNLRACSLKAMFVVVLTIVLIVTTFPFISKMANADPPIDIDISSSTGVANYYTYSSDVYTIITNGAFNISGTGTKKVVVANSTTEVTLNINDLNMTSLTADHCCIDILGASVSAIFTGTNSFSGSIFVLPTASFTIDGTGTVTATGRGDNVAGIGGSNRDNKVETYYTGNYGKIIINGANITANATGSNGAGIGGGKLGKGTIIINGGNIQATGAGRGAGIGSAGLSSGTVPDGGDITINGGIITASATGSQAGAGIGGAGSSSAGGAGGNITINGGTINATGSGGSAGIGGGGASGASGTGGSIKINGGNIKATGVYGGAGIGGSNGAAGGNITISDGTINASGSTINGSAGIGGGQNGAGGNIIILGGKITSTGSGGGAGIGGGWSGSGGSITISGGAVNASGSNGGAGIGGGNNSFSGTVVIYGGTVNSPTIGNGSNYLGAEGSLTMDGGSLKANSVSFSDAIKNSAGANIYRNILKIKSDATWANQRVTAVSINGVQTELAPNAQNDIYGIKDVYTDATSNVYFYLPATAAGETQAIWTEVDGHVYAGLFVSTSAGITTTLYQPKASMSAIGLENLKTGEAVQDAKLVVELYASETVAEIASFVDAVATADFHIAGLPAGLSSSLAGSSSLRASMFNTLANRVNNVTVEIPIVGVPTEATNSALVSLVISSGALKGKLPPIPSNSIGVSVVQTFTITYNGNGNTGGSPPTDSTLYLEDENALVLGNVSMVKTNSTFLGWSTDPGATVAQYIAGDSIAMSASIELFAIWRTNSTSGGDDDKKGEHGDYNPNPDDKPVLGYDEDGNPIYDYTPDGKPIIGYTPDGKPILGYGPDGQIIIGYDKNGNAQYIYTADGKAIVGWNREGRPIIGWDKYGNPIYGIEAANTGDQPIPALPFILMLAILAVVVYIRKTQDRRGWCFS